MVSYHTMRSIICKGCIFAERTTQPFSLHVFICAIFCGLHNELESVLDLLRVGHHFGW